MPAHVTRKPRQHSDYFRPAIMLFLAVAALYAGKAVLVPLALALLLAFILTPLVMSIERLGLNRVLSVLSVLCITLAVGAGVGYGVGSQIGKLANQLPEYVSQAKAKIERLREHSAGPLSRAIEAFQGVDAAAAKDAKPDAPAPLVVTEPQSSAIQNLTGVALVVVEPVADTALIIILVAFMLVRREDLRNRVIGLLGHGRLTGTTRVFVESAERISRLLLMQLCVNTGCGLVFGIGLLLIGVKYWFLWGFLTAILRFVPYVGSWLAALFPILLSFAVAPGWTQPIEVLSFFILLDLITGNVVEPVLFGHSTGVTPVALLVAAVFWTWVWGPVGLVLSTPLTVCLVVMGQNVPSLRFLSLLMGDQAPLEPHAAYYQRLLAGDPAEAQQIAMRYGRDQGLAQLSDVVLMPALRMARQDRVRAGLTATDESLIFDSTQNLIDALKTIDVASPETLAVGVRPRVLGCAAHHRAEELGLALLSTLLDPVCEMKVISTRVLPSAIEKRVQDENPAVVFIAILPPGGVSQAKHLCSRLRKRFPDLKIVVGYLGKVRNFDLLLTTLRKAGATYVSTSIMQSQKQITELLPIRDADTSAPLSVKSILPVAPTPAAHLPEVVIK